MEYSSFQFTVKNLDKTFDFYSNVLGFDIEKVSTEDEFDFLIMQQSDHEIMFEQESVVKKLHPRVIICGHVHEDPGWEHLNDTLVVNCSVGHHGVGTIIDLKKGVQVEQII